MWVPYLFWSTWFPLLRHPSAPSGQTYCSILKNPHDNDPLPYSRTSSEATPIPKHPPSQKVQYLEAYRELCSPAGGDTHAHLHTDVCMSNNFNASLAARPCTSPWSLGLVVARPSELAWSAWPPVGEMSLPKFGDQGGMEDN